MSNTPDTSYVQIGKLVYGPCKSYAEATRLSNGEAGGTVVDHVGDGCTLVPLDRLATSARSDLVTTIDGDTGEIVDGKPFEFTSKGLTIHGKPTLEQWIAFGQVLVDASSSLQWAIGDWINYGESRTEWGEKYTQALSAFQYKYEYLRNIAWVSRKFELSRRHDNLTFAHHQEVAALDTPTQDKLLDRAERKQMSSHEVRHEVQQITGRTHGNELDRFEGNFDQAVNWLADMKFKHGWQKRIRIVIFEA